MKKLWKPALLLTAVLIMVFGIINSGAWFSASKTADGGTLQSGTLSIGDPGAYGFSLGSVPPMAPGDKTNDVVIYVNNTGTTNLAWFGDLVISGSPKLQKAIYIDYAKMEFLGGTWAEPDDNFILGGKGSGPYPDWYNTLAAKNTFGLVGLDVFDGSSGMGSAPYEFMGALKPGFAYKLTLRFGFAEQADNSYQGLGPLSISYKVDATQIKTGALNALHAGFGDNTDNVKWLNDQIANQTP